MEKSVASPEGKCMKVRETLSSEVVKDATQYETCSSSVSTTAVEKMKFGNGGEYLQSSRDFSDPSSWPSQDEMSDEIRCFLSNMIATQPEVYPNCVDFSSSERDNRHLTPSMWYKILPNGEKIKRNWLIYSKMENSLFCVPCKLFLERANTTGCLSALQTNGFKNWKKISEKLPQHESSTVHTCCVVKWMTFLKTIKNFSGINKQLEKSIEDEKKKWKQIIYAVIDAVLFLATNNLSFRGSHENPHTISSAHLSKAQGNFLNLISLLSRHNSALGNALENLKKGQVSYLSSTIQNEIIELMAEKVREAIVKEILSAKYFTIMFDSTQDISHCEQMSEVIRYVKIDSDGTCEIKESFIDFIDLHGKTGEYISQIILSKLEKDSLNIADCRGQSYDNGSNMSGMYKGVQTRIQEKNKFAVFVPCIAHSLNLVGVHAASSCREASNLFGIVQRIFCFFASSTARWEIMKRYTGSNLKGTSQTRWSAKWESVNALKTNLAKVAQGLEEIKQGNFPPEAKSDAGSLLHAITDFKFILNLVIWNSILREVNRVNIEIQKSDIILSRSICLMEGLIATLQRLRNFGFEGWHEEAVNIATSMSVETALKDKRKSKRKRMFDETANDESCRFSYEKLFMQDINIIFDKMLTELKTRTESTKILNTEFSFLCGEKLIKMNSEDLKTSATHLAAKYSKDLNGIELTSELEAFKDQAQYFCENIEKLSCKDLLSVIHTNELQNAFPNLCIALRIYSTLPTTSATCERTFSKMKLIKSYLRSTMHQERLSNLAILSIESDVANTISYEDAVKSFAEKKARKVKF